MTSDIAAANGAAEVGGKACILEGLDVRLSRRRAQCDQSGALQYGVVL